MGYQLPVSQRRFLNAQGRTSAIHYSQAVVPAWSRDHRRGQYLFDNHVGWEVGRHFQRKASIDLYNIFFLSFNHLPLYNSLSNKPICKRRSVKRLCLTIRVSEEHTMPIGFAAMQIEHRKTYLEFEWTQPSTIVLPIRRSYPNGSDFSPPFSSLLPRVTLSPLRWWNVLSETMQPFRKRHRSRTVFSVRTALLNRKHEFPIVSWWMVLWSKKGEQISKSIFFKLHKFEID